MKAVLVNTLLFYISAFGYAQTKPHDSTLTISKNISTELIHIGDHGVLFFEHGKLLNHLVVKKELELIRRLATINEKNYKISVIKQGKYFIKIYKGKKGVNPYRLVEVVTQDSSKHKKIPLINTNYLVLFNSMPHTIELEIDENGVNYYKVGDRKVNSVRESILYIDDEFDKSVFKGARVIIDKFKSEKTGNSSN